MKVNKKVSDLARKLDFIQIGQEDRRIMIKKCVNPLRLIQGFNLIVQINYCYEDLKKKVEGYNKLCKENERLKKEYSKTINDIYPIMN